MLVLGLGDGFKNQEIMRMRVSGLSNNEVSILLYQSEAGNGPELAVNIPVMFPVSFLYFSNDFLIFPRELPNTKPIKVFAPCKDASLKKVPKDTPKRTPSMPMKPKDALRVHK